MGNSNSSPKVSTNEENYYKYADTKVTKSHSIRHEEINEDIFVELFSLEISKFL